MSHVSWLSVGLSVLFVYSFLSGRKRVLGWRLEGLLSWLLRGLEAHISSWMKTAIMLQVSIQISILGETGNRYSTSTLCSSLVDHVLAFYVKSATFLDLGMIDCNSSVERLTV